MIISHAVRQINNILLICVILISLSAASGCASSDTSKLHDDMEAMKNQLWSLQKQTSEMSLRFAYATDDIALLSERVARLEDEGVKKPSADKGAQARDSQEGKSDSTRPEKGFDTPPEPGFKDLPPDEMYRQSLIYFNKGDYTAAVGGLNYLIRRHPTSGLAPNAQYWIGEAFFSQKRYSKAEEEFQKVLNRYPGSTKTADTMLKIAECKIALDRGPEGEEVLREIITRFPDSAAAATAMKIMEKEGSGVEGGGIKAGDK